jgi:hypothetical protein
MMNLYRRFISRAANYGDANTTAITGVTTDNEHAFLEKESEKEPANQRHHVPTTNSLPTTSQSL